MTRRLLAIVLFASCLMLPALFLSGCSAGMVDSISDRPRILDPVFKYPRDDINASRGRLDGATGVAVDAEIIVVYHPDDAYVDLRVWTWRAVGNRFVRQYEGYTREEIDKSLAREKIIFSPYRTLASDTTYVADVMVGYRGERVFARAVFSTGDQLSLIPGGLANEDG